ncbi:MAG TPA: DUF2231 domain-containing protein [Burkholderiales bacterium]|nr:DUF2231 domain-containing protein [Burkholderiales bacterium]
MIDLIHVHPMIVHFPIVLFLIGSGLELLVLARGGDLARRACLANTALAAIILAAAGAAVAAFFGDIAFDHAVGVGFPRAPLERHADFGYTTMWLLIAYAAFYLLAWWRGLRLSGGRGWAWFAASLAGVALVLTTAYFGGDLVYGIGVNVAHVTP